ncbi:unnamed protein product [Pocillopora meandrina]|uniref:Nephrocystin-3 n=1 Tax=Pocillopora meandrina TaxID=46732 RepID=A0AAU9WTV2_9CNID|nr:unnamed protein product [Pocillopora meandrina]
MIVHSKLAQLDYKAQLSQQDKKDYLIGEMAAATDPSKALDSTPEKTNFQRAARLLICGGTMILREIFDKIHPPKDLPIILNDPAIKSQLAAARITKPQWDCLYPSPGTYGKSEDFDVTLLFKLLRTICNLHPPASGWDDLPASADHSLTADLARIKYYRNTVYGHVNQRMEIRNEEFQLLWQEIREALLRIARSISSTKGTEWEDAIDKLLNDPLTAEDDRNVKELLHWYRNDIEIKELVEAQNIKNQLGEEAQNIKDQLDKLKVSSEVHQASGVQLQMRIDCKTIKESPVPGASENGSTRGSEAMRIGSDCLPSSEEVLNFIALKYFKEVDASSPHERNEFLQYLKDVRKLLLVDTQIGSIIITVECSSLQVLDELWDDHSTGHLNEMAQKHLVTEEILNKFGLIEVQLSTTIREEEYRAAQEYFMKCSVNDAKPRGTTLPYGKEHVDVADAQSSLSPTKPKFLGDFQQVQEPYERPLDSQLKILGPGYVDVAIAHHSLGNVHIDLRDLQQAKDHYERALDIQLKKLGPTHVDVARTYHSLGYVNLNLGNLQQAITDYARALDIRQRIKAKEYFKRALSIASMHENQGNAYLNVGDLQFAKEHYERSLAIRLRTLRLPRKHAFLQVAVARTYHSLGNVNLSLGNLQQVITDYARALNIRKRMFGIEDIHVALSCHNMGVVYQQLGDLQQAQECFEIALQIRLKKLEPNHDDVTRSYHTLSVLHHQLGDLRKATEYQKRAVHIELKKL